MRWAAVVILLAACSFTHGLAPGDGGDASPGADAHFTTDATMVHDGVQAIDAPSGCLGTGLGVQACLAHPPTQSLTITFIRGISTNVGSGDCDDLVGPQASDFCVMSGMGISISGTLVATGTRPLVLVATGDLTVTGTIDVASHLAVVSTRGAGADPSACAVSAAPGSTGGGAGGSFGSKGGNGGNGASGALAADVVTSIELRGGCPGSQGADHTTLGGPGHGGGAVDLIAAGMITISGTIDASGEGGAGAGVTHNGGDGGGSGGLIVLDAPVVTLGSSAKIYANGGGGGGGSTTGLGGGGDGGDPGDPGTGGHAGSGPDGAADGGVGAHNVAPGQPGASSTIGDGGGGGGGGVGVIRVFQSALPTGGSVSPPL